jgi:hypothetical protein
MSTKVCGATGEMKEKERGCDGVFWQRNRNRLDNIECIGCKQLKEEMAKIK